jgi:hypothetical protein
VLLEIAVKMRASTKRGLRKICSNPLMMGIIKKLNKKYKLSLVTKCTQKGLSANEDHQKFLFCAF